jgi:hypothetical protein
MKDYSQGLKGLLYLVLLFISKSISNFEHLADITLFMWRKLSLLITEHIEIVCYQCWAA